MTLTCEHQDWPDFTVFLTIKISPKNISKTLSPGQLLEEKPLMDNFGKKVPSAKKYGCK